MALADQGKLGLPVTAFVSVILQSHNRRTSREFRTAVAKIPQVLECHHIAGEFVVNGVTTVFVNILRAARG